MLKINASKALKVQELKRIFLSPLVVSVEFVCTDCQQWEQMTKQLKIRDGEKKKRRRRREEEEGLMRDRDGAHQ